MSVPTAITTKRNIVHSLAVATTMMMVMMKIAALDDGSIHIQ